MFSVLDLEKRRKKIRERVLRLVKIYKIPVVYKTVKGIALNMDEDKF
jgi:hypothetical protein